jgi:hypothetical protein
VTVVAVTASEVEVLPAERVDELTALRERVAVLAVENDGLWSEIAGLLGENERLQRI